MISHQAWKHNYIKMVLSSVMQDWVILGEIKLFKVKSFMYTVCLGIFVDFLDIYESVNQYQSYPIMILED